MSDSGGQNVAADLLSTRPEIASRRWSLRLMDAISGSTAGIQNVSATMSLTFCPPELEKAILGGSA